METDSRQRGAGGAQQRGHESVRGRTDDAEPEDTAGPATDEAGVVLEAVHLGEDGPGPVEEEAAGLGEIDPAGGAREQLGVEFVLELLDLLRQGRLRHVQTGGGATEVAFLRHGDEVPQMT
ncbi:hypothetical protein GCM10009755_08450 [Brevibacterium samyangense]|uniref:Uncharacterized protein n=1 Tax=Brevibacterium samyangense TaxID=366888 RepID=A0ABP5EM33_9MICO